MKVNTSKISNTAWGDVDKSALGNKVADAYASGDITKAQIKLIYAFVPDEAFTEDSDGKPKFLASKAWGPHAEISDGEIVQNKGGVFAAAGALAGARSNPDLSGGDLATAKAAIRRCYSQMNMEMPDSLKESNKPPKGRRIEERLGHVQLAEADGTAPRRVRANDVIVADVVNGNGRRYPSSVIRSAIEEMRAHLNEGTGHGRVIQYLGEAEHPSDKSTRRPNLMETVIRWDDVSFDGNSVSLGGNILETSRGKDVLALMEGNIQPGVSLRGYGETESIKEHGVKFEEVTNLRITGFDLVVEPSFEQAEAMLESQQGEKEMSEEELMKLLKDHPELFEGVTESQVKKMGEAQLKKLEESIREKLGVDGSADIGKALDEAVAAKKELAEQKRKTTVEKLITEATKDLPYGEKGNKAFVAAVQSANPQDEAVVKSLIESKRKEYDVLFAERKLKGMGFTSDGLHVMGPVLEAETGTPEFARAAFMINESMNSVQLKMRRDLLKPKSQNEVFTVKLLERFDRLHKYELTQESKLLTEADEGADLNLPYSVSRALIEQVWPTLIATGLIDTGVIDTSPTRIYYERIAGESGYTGTVTTEAFTSSLDKWVMLAHGRLTAGTVVITHSITTYTEGSDYVVDYAAGAIKALSTGAMADATADNAAYQYSAMRNGEMQAIPRSKMSLTFMVAEAAADRIADQISREAIVFGRSQMNYDVQARLLVNIAKQINTIVDKDILYAAWSAVKSVANNHPSAWTAGNSQDDYDDAVRLIGDAKAIVYRRFYDPTFILCSTSIAEVLSNWKGFTRLGFPDAVLNSTGFAGGVKGLPIYASTQFPDTEILVGNMQLVMYRVFQPLMFRGPYPTYDGSGNLIAADQYYGEQFDVTVTPVPEKGAYLTIEGTPS